MARPDKSVRVEVPKPDEDRPELARVGVIAAVGFVIGVAWPWLAGVQLVPSAPAEEVEASPAPSASAAPSAPQAARVAPKPKPKPGPKRTKKQSVEIGEAIVASCRDARGRKLGKCDRIQFDPLAKPRLMALAECDPAKGASKLLSIGFDLDFEKNEIRDIESGKSTTFSKEKTKALLKCAEKEFASVKLDDLDHEHARYSIYYFVEFVPPGTLDEKEPSKDEEDEATEASGMATVQWDSAQIRESPPDGDVRARLRYGTRVAVTGRRGDWYLIKYDAKGREGWVHKNALGL